MVTAVVAVVAAVAAVVVLIEVIELIVVVVVQGLAVAAAAAARVPVAASVDSMGVTSIPGVINSEAASLATLKPYSPKS